GIALAFSAAARGYRITLAMPESMSIERRHLLRALGAGVELTPAGKGMSGAIARAKELASAIPNARTPGQFTHPAKPAGHDRTAGPELWESTRGAVDTIGCGVGTGGTITGVTRFLRKHNRHRRASALEPKESPVISGGSPAPHRIQGIGAGF